MRRIPEYRSSRLTVAIAFAGARGVTVRSALGYLLAWAVVAGASRFSITALGLQFAPPGSSPLDTVGVMFLLLPAPLLATCLTSRTPTLEATRASRFPGAQTAWVGCVVGVGVGSPWAVAATLHPAIDKRAFFATWLTVFGIVLLLAVIASTLVAALSAFAVLALFSTPHLLPWPDNLIYNVDRAPITLSAGAALVVAGAALHVVRLCR